MTFLVDNLKYILTFAKKQRFYLTCFLKNKMKKKSYILPQNDDKWKIVYVSKSVHHYPWFDM